MLHLGFTPGGKIPEFTLEKLSRLSARKLIILKCDGMETLMGQCQGTVNTLPILFS